MQPNRALLVMVTAPLFFFAGHLWHADIDTPAAPVAPAEAQGAAPALVRYAPGAPQLQFVHSEGVVLLPEPLLEPLTGRIAYDENHTARVAAPIAGRVVRIEVQPGDRVAAGAPLAWIDAPDYAAAVADVHKADTEVQHRNRAFQRSQELLDGGVIPRKDFEAADADLKQAQAERHRAQLRLRNLTVSGGGEDGRFALRAPLAGVIVDRQVNPGAEVRPDAPTPLFVVTDPRRMWAIVDLPERYLGKIHAGQSVSVEVDAYRGIDVLGRVASIGQALDPATRRVQVRCVVDDPRELLKPEMFARIVPLAEERQKLPRVPNAALVTEGVHSAVFVEVQPGAFERRPVTLGLQGRDESYVKSGLEPGERVVVSGALLLESELAARH